MINIKPNFSIALLTLFLTACGGSGGDNSNAGRETINNSTTQPVPSTATAAVTTSPVTTSPVTTSPVTSTASIPASPAITTTVNTTSPSSSNSGKPVTAVAATDGSVSTGTTASVTATVSRPPGTDVPVTTPDIRSAQYEGYTISTDLNNGLQQTDPFTHNKSSASTDLFTITIAENKTSIKLRDKRGSSTDTDNSRLEPTSQQIMDLKDIDGSLIGYYGWGSAVDIRPNPDNVSVEVKSSILDIFYAINKATSRLPAQNDVQYQGVFLYSKEKEGFIRQAKDAVFHYKDKKIDGSIREYSGSTAVAHWIVDGDKTVADDGTFHIRLTSLSDSIHGGEMEGGFFGKNGQILTANAKSTGGEGDRRDTKDKWQGIFIATKKSKP